MKKKFCTNVKTQVNESMYIRLRHKQREQIKQRLREVLESAAVGEPTANHVLMFEALWELLQLERIARAYRLRAVCLLGLVVALGAAFLLRH